jgi:YbgC/YbaW family acyl-CoA thioester hydrolase
MARIQVELPPTFIFSTIIPVRITDLNYGGHVGNDTILSLIHEARIQFLKHYGYSETDLAGTGMIMSDVAIVFKNELFYGDGVRIHVAVSDISRASFDVVYRLEKESEGKTVIVAHAKTGMVCFDYSRRKVTALPEEVKEKWGSS